VTTFWTVLWQEMKLGYLITHLRISDNQCNDATHSPRAKKFKTSSSNRNIMATIFWDRKGPRRDATNAGAYCETLKKLRRAIPNKRRGMVTRGVCLLHDNACPHNARAPRRSCCSPSSGKYWPISKLKDSLAGKTFSDDDEVQDMAKRAGGRSLRRWNKKNSFPGSLSALRSMVTMLKVNKGVLYKCYK
jgi:hypothetical protein